MYKTNTHLICEVQPLSGPVSRMIKRLSLSFDTEEYGGSEKGCDTGFDTGKMIYYLLENGCSLVQLSRDADISLPYIKKHIRAYLEKLEQEHMDLMLYYPVMMDNGFLYTRIAYDANRYIQQKYRCA